MILENAVDTTDFTDGTDFQSVLKPCGFTHQVNQPWPMVSLQLSVSVQSA
jgi:hypothetical protein